MQSEPRTCVLRLWPSLANSGLAHAERGARSPPRKEWGDYAHSPWPSDHTQGLILSAGIEAFGGGFQTPTILEGDAVAEPGD